MKRIIIILLLFAATKVAGQTIGYLRFDTVMITKAGGTAELVLLNKTKDTVGILANPNGNGRTRFMRSRAINDSTIVVGPDTLVLKGYNTNTGTGYRWATDGSNEIKTFTPSFGLLLDSTINSGSITGQVDSFSVLTRGYGQYKIDSLAAELAGGGGNDNVNVGSGYRILIPGTQEIKTLFPKWGNSIDSTTNSDALTLGADSTHFSTIANRTKGLDSLSATLRSVINDTASAHRTKINQKIDSVRKRAGTDSVFFYRNGEEVFAFLDANNIYEGFLKNNNSDFGLGIFRFDGSGGIGTDVQVELLENSEHTPYLFGDHIETTATGFRLYIPTAKQVQFVVAHGDEIIGDRVVCGEKFNTDGPSISTYYNRGVAGLSFTGDGSGGLSGVSGWSVSYTPTTGRILLTHPTSVFGASGNSTTGQLEYYGPNPWRLERLTSGLSGHNMGWVILDNVYGTPIVDTLQTTDKFTIQSSLMMPQTFDNRTVNSTTVSLYAGGFANYWVFCAVQRDPLTPGPITGRSVTAGNTELTLDWDDVDNATEYEVERSTHAHYGFTNVYTGTASTFTDTGLTNGTTYYYRIRSTDGGTRHSAWWKAQGTPTN
jgi:hypothetical protein